ncbi:TRAF3-interacting protein 1-like isoform X5 [Dreissena polymorpha]|uniref:TRAF3-interacting protein 1-like isoform X5 n=1 Tax=Dreissena polymorpha TaxID=45954 RepID=UPI002264ECFA|nr:TRAF3-interacting protein 1-like isoform X5 [Dreissena polymorpha]
MDPKIAKKTQDSLGKFIKKPPLTEKLLSKPPFRFLHDVMTSVIKTTGVMKGLYTDSEMNSENVKDKDSKIAFLQKAVDYVSNASGKTLSVKPAKVVAGHEPEKTNEFLQALAAAIGSKVDNDSVVDAVNNKGGKPSSSKEEKKEEKEATPKEPERQKSSDRQKKDDAPQEKRSRDRADERNKDRDDKRRDKDDKQRDRDDKRRGSEDKHKDRDDKPKERDAKPKDRDDKQKERDDKQKDRDDKSMDRERESRQKSGRSRRREEDGKENDAPKESMVNGDVKAGETPSKVQRPTSAKGSRRRMEETGQKIEDDDTPTQPAGRLARPSSARPAPPKRKEDTVQQEPAMRLGSGKPQNLILDDGKDSDEDETFIVEEAAAPPPELEQPAPQAGDDDDEDHGGLVKKIMETKKEYEQPRENKIERPTISDAQRRKQREAVQKEIDKLRSSIQTLTRSANPLGKIMDYVQEDLDSMQKELEKWKQENKEHSLALKREKAITERAVEPLKAQLSEVDQAIKDQLDLIGAVKSNIIRNDQKMEKMLRTIAKS